MRAVRKGGAGDARKATMLGALEAVFGPLARLLLAHGVSSPEAESLLRAVCVHQAANTAAGHRKKPNASRAALVTGVDRAEVARILKGAPRLYPQLETRRHRVNRVLAGWYSDSHFIDGNRPMRLQIKAGTRGRPTFWALASRYAPGVYPGLILAELLRIGAVEKLQDGRVQVRMRRYGAGEFSDAELTRLGVRARDLLQTLIGNALGASWPRVCRVVEMSDIDPRFLPLIRKMFADRSNAMLSGIEEELKSARWRRSKQADRRVRVGMTVFSYEEGSEERTSNETAKVAYPAVRKPSKSRRGTRSTRAA